jgi:hypothetical protein
LLWFNMRHAVATPYIHDIREEDDAGALLVPICVRLPNLSLSSERPLQDAEPVEHFLQVHLLSVAFESVLVAG